MAKIDRRNMSFDVLDPRACFSMFWTPRVPHHGGMVPWQCGTRVPWHHPPSSDQNQNPPSTASQPTLTHHPVRTFWTPGRKYGPCQEHDEAWPKSISRRNFRRFGPEVLHSSAEAWPKSTPEARFSTFCTPGQKYSQKLIPEARFLLLDPWAEVWPKSIVET